MKKGIESKGQTATLPLKEKVAGKAQMPEVLCGELTGRQVI
jgi:hypothetical protein